MEWSDVINDPSLKDLPYKVELNEWGQIVLSPASNQHGLLQAEVAGFLRDNRNSGKVLVECSINTIKGVKVADIAWGSAEFFDRNDIVTPYDEAPDLCVEIISPSNNKREIEEKINLFLAKGAREVWICQQDGTLEIHGHRGRIEKSILFGNAPEKFIY